MQLTFRWFGESDPVPLEHIRQIPGVHGIVTALHEVPVGEPWPAADLKRRIATIGEAGLALDVIESVSVHEDIKLGLPDRDRFADAFCESVRVIGGEGIRVLCYNFMPVFDWMRTRLDAPLPDGSTTLLFEQSEMERTDPVSAPPGLPAWPVGDGRPLGQVLRLYETVTEEQLWENLAWFLERVVPVAEESGVLLAIHPDDPPWSIFGLPRIIRDLPALQRLVSLVDSPNNGVTFCTGSLGAKGANDLPAMVRALGDRIHFAHCRNVKRTGPRSFVEVPHPGAWGDVDMLEVLRALREVGFTGPMRPDHGRMIWGETGRPGYGLYDRALGAMYLQGLWEGLGGKESVTAAASPST